MTRQIFGLRNGGIKKEYHQNLYMESYFMSWFWLQGDTPHVWTWHNTSSLNYYICFHQIEPVMISGSAEITLATITNISKYLDWLLIDYFCLFGKMSEEPSLQIRGYKSD